LFAVVLVVAGLVVAFNNKGDDDNLETQNTNTTRTTGGDSGFVLPTTVEPTSSTTSTTTRSGSSNSTTTSTTSTTTKSSAADTEVKEQKCINTTESDAVLDPDWQSYWTTQPDPNYPVEILICIDDWKPKVGQQITLSLRVRDADQKITQGQCDIRVTWEGPPPDCRQDVIVEPKRKPDDHVTDLKTRNQVTLSQTHTYGEAGEQTVLVRVWSGPDDKHRHTYANYNSIQLNVEVHK
jgi:hypothetical protein